MLAVYIEIDIEFIFIITYVSKDVEHMKTKSNRMLLNHHLYFAFMYDPDPFSLNYRHE